MNKTYGEKRCNVDFNPSNNDYVHQIKSKIAEVMNLIDSSAAKPHFDDAQLKRFNKCKEKALLDLESAQMFAVKAEFVQ